MTPSARYMAVLGTLKYFALGGTGAVLLLVSHLDRFGRTFAIVCAGAGLPFGAYKLWRALQIPPDVPMAGSVDNLPENEQLPALRRNRIIVTVLFSFLSAWTAYDLRQLDTGAVDSTSTFAPSVLAYEFLGFWPAVSVLPALTLLAWWVITRRMRQVSGRQR
jgi:hypothetical protein